MIWSYSLFRDGVPVNIFSQPKANKVDIMSRPRNPGALLLVNSDIRNEVKPIFFSQTRFVAGNTARRAGTPANISGFRKFLRHIQSRDLGHITELNLDIHLERTHSAIRLSSYTSRYVTRGDVRLRSLNYIVESVTKVFLGLRNLHFAVFYEKIPNGHRYQNRVHAQALNSGVMSKALDLVLSRIHVLKFRVEFHDRMDMGALIDEVARRHPQYSNSKTPSGGRAIPNYPVHSVEFSRILASQP
jgi:hypothetical protein